VHVSTSSDRPSGPASASGAGDRAEPVDPAPRPSRRVFSPEYKLAMVTEYERAPNGEKGAILRREGLYSSHIIEWSRARDAGALTGACGTGEASVRSGRKSAEQRELEQLRRKNAKLEAELSKTRMALDIMGKAHALLEQISESADEER
jgi:transposase